MSGKRKNTGKNHKKKRGKRWSPAEIVILIAAAAVLCVSAFQLVSIFLEYKAGSDAYDSLRNRYVQINGEKVEDQAGETENGEGTEAESFPDITIDFDQLEAINQALTGWIYIPVLDIEYPVVQGTNNTYYLDHTFEKKENKAGAIFMDYSADPQMTDYNTFIYGHNMKNGSMFGKLKNFIRDEELCDSRPYIYYFTREKIYQYLIVSYYVTEDGSYSYSLPADETEYEDYVSYILMQSPYKCSREIPQEGPVLSLSTCYGSAGGTQRFLVHGILTAVQDAE